MDTEIDAPFEDLEDAEAAYKRIEPEANAITEAEFSALNLDVVAATSVILGVAPRILAYRARIAQLAEFDMRCVDGLVDRAKAAWYAVVTNLPEPEPKDFQVLFDECVALRTTLLAWAVPLVHAKHFDQAAVAKIKEGSRHKDIPSDVVALVALYRSRWDDIKTVCGVTEAELERGAAIAPAVFSTLSRRENKSLTSLSDSSLRVRRFWTLADRAYRQCQRALAYLEWDMTDVASIAPSLRRNAGGRSTPSSNAATKLASTDAPESASAPAPDAETGAAS